MPIVSESDAGFLDLSVPCKPPYSTPWPTKANVLEHWRRLATPSIRVNDNQGAEARESQITDDELEAELLRRERSQVSFVDYVRSVEIPGSPADESEVVEQFLPVESQVADVHRLFCREIQTAMETPYGRLIILAPPGSAKSTYGSALAPTWYLSKYAHKRIICASYSSDIASIHSRKARSIARQPAHQSIWPTPITLDDEQRAVADWALSNGSSYLAAGLKASITGRRAHGFIVDDPVRNQADADSETVQNGLWAEYNSSVTSRLLPGAFVIIIQTLWSERDIAARILGPSYDGRSGDWLGTDGQIWRVVRVPARCEEVDDPLGREIGEYLWTEYYPEQHWKIRENNMGAKRTWASLYQQRITPDEGVEFERVWFEDNLYDPDVPRGTEGGLPRTLSLILVTDYATKPDREADFSEHGVFGIDPKQHYYVTDWWSGQTATNITINNAISLLRYWRPQEWVHEGGPIGHALTPAMQDGMRLAGYADAYAEPSPMPSVKGKAVKLSAFQKIAAEGRVHFPKNRPWAKRVIEQLVNFPAGKHDDAADVCGLAGRKLAEVFPPWEPEARPTQRSGPKQFTEEWWRQDGTNQLKPRHF